MTLVIAMKNYKLYALFSSIKIILTLFGTVVYAKSNANYYENKMRSNASYYGDKIRKKYYCCLESCYQSKNEAKQFCAKHQNIIILFKYCFNFLNIYLIIYAHRKFFCYLKNKIATFKRKIK